MVHQNLRLALLGDPPRGKVWYEAIEDSDRHDVVAALASDLTGVTAYDHWQPLAAEGAIDAALLFSADDELCEAARQLAVRGRGLVIDWECLLPSSLVAELGLLDAEQTAVVVPFFDWRAFPVLHELRELARGGRLGDVVLLRMEFDLPREAAPPADRLLNDDVIQATLVPHIDTLRWIGGDYSQVTLLRTGVTPHGFAAQTLNLAGARLPDATCVYRVGKSSRWMCEVQGSLGTASAHLDGDGMRLIVDVETVRAQDEPHPDPALCLRLLDDAMARRPGSLRWQDRVRIHEIQEAMQRSLRRRRTIDLHFDETSERSQFKTQMATVGCFVLVYTFVASVLLLLAGAVLDPRDQLQRRSDAAGFVVHRDQFEPSTARLNPSGIDRIAHIARDWEQTAAVVLVEGDTGPPEAATDRRKLETVRRHLDAAGVRRVAERSLVRPVAGRGFQRFMAAARVIAFAPLGLFLLLQVLLFLSRPPRDRHNRRR